MTDMFEEELDAFIEAMKEGGAPDQASTLRMLRKCKAAISQLQLELHVEVINNTNLRQTKMVLDEALKMARDHIKSQRDMQEAYHGSTTQH